MFGVTSASLMPPLKPVERLEKLCGSKIANHLFSVFSSWYKYRDGFQFDLDSDYIETESLGNATYLKVNGCMNNDTEEFEEKLMQDCDDREDKYIQQLPCASEVTEGRKRFRSGTASPVPLQYAVIDAITHVLAREVRGYLSTHLAPRFKEEIVELLINIIASKVDLPGPKNKLRIYEDDLGFMSLLAFLLCMSLKCLCTKGVTALDLSPISHLVKKWQLLCWGGDIVNRDGEECKCPSFDIFGFSFDSGVSGLKTLKYLKLPHFVYNSFVRKVAYLCPNLEVLILRCSADCANPKYDTPVVTNMEVLYGDSVLCPDDKVMPGCKDLVALALPEGVETLDVTNDAVEMLAYMPNLQYFVGAPMIYVTEEFEDIFEHFPEPPKLTNFHHGAYGRLHWQSFVYDESSLAPNPEYLSRVFSQVKEVAIYAPSEVTEKVLKSFSKAQDITIFTDDFEVHGKYLKNLTSLDINVGYQEEWPILISLSQTSPKLEKLTLRSFSLQMDDSLGQNPAFPSLHTLKFHGQNVLQGDALLVFLRGCPALTTFILSMMTDEDGDSQLDEQTLLQAIPLLTRLQKFVYKVQSALRTQDGVPSSLTMLSCLALIDACPNLMYIGQLETWKITRYEINTLQEMVRGKNWDLEIA